MIYFILALIISTVGISIAFYILSNDKKHNLN